MQRTLLVLVILFSVSTAHADIIPSCPPGQHAERGPSVDGHPGPSSCVPDAAEPVAEPVAIEPVADVQPAAEPATEPAAAEPAEEASSGCSIGQGSVGQGRGGSAWMLLGLALVGVVACRRRA